MRTFYDFCLDFLLRLQLRFSVVTFNMSDQYHKVRKLFPAYVARLAFIRKLFILADFSKSVQIIILVHRLANLLLSWGLFKIFVKKPALCDHGFSRDMSFTIVSFWKPVMRTKFKTTVFTWKPLITSQSWTAFNCFTFWYLIFILLVSLLFQFIFFCTFTTVWVFFPPHIWVFSCIAFYPHFAYWTDYDNYI